MSKRIQMPCYYYFFLYLGLFFIQLQGLLGCWWHSTWPSSLSSLGTHLLRRNATSWFNNRFGTFCIWWFGRKNV